MTGVAINQNAIFAQFTPNTALNIDDLEKGTGIKRHELIKAAGKLVERGYISRMETGVFALSKIGERAKAEKEIIKSGPMRPDCGKGRKPFKDTLRQKAWNAMRIQVVFSINDITSLAVDDPTTAHHNNLQRYCRALVQANYLVVAPTKERGTALTSNGFIRYRLVNDTGDICPTFRAAKNEVYDHNLGEVFSCQR